MIRPPTKAIAPSGTSVLRGEADVDALRFRLVRRLSRLASRKVNVFERSRVKSSGPIDQWTWRLSPDQWMLKPASREMRAVGIALDRRTEIDRTAGVRERRDEGVPALLERDPLAVGRRHDLGRVVGLEVDDVVAARQRRRRIADADADEHGLAARGNR